MHSSQYPDPSAQAAAGHTLGPGTLQELIAQARQLRDDLEAFRRCEPEETGTHRVRQAVWDLAVQQAEDCGEQLRQLRGGPGHQDGPTGHRGQPAPPGAAGSGGRVGSAEWSLITDGVVWSDEMYAMFGRSPADGPLTLDQLPSWLLPEDRPAFTSGVTSCLIDARTMRCELRITRPDGDRRTVQFSGEPLLDEGGNTIAMWAMVRDVSGLRDAHRALPADSSAPRMREVPPEPPNTPAAASDPALAPWLSSPARPARPDVPGSLELAAAYIPAAQGLPSEGKWHDWLELPDGSSVLSVGDLAGRGPAATAGTATALGALRGIALTGAAPGRVLDHLNELLDSGTHPLLASLVLCRYTPQNTTLTWAQAGHPAPLLCRGSSGRILPRPGGTLLGAVSGPYGEAYGERTDLLRSGDTLVLQTDGLFPGSAQGPAGSGGRGTDPRLLGLAAQLSAAPSAQDALRVITRTCEDLERPEDVCLLVARVS